MKIETGVERLEAASPSRTPDHVILAAEGEWGAAFDAYGRDKIADIDRVMVIELYSGAAR